MRSALVAVLGMAAALAAVGLLLWTWAAQRQARSASMRHIDQQLGPALHPTGIEMQFGMPPPAAELQPPASRQDRWHLPDWLDGVATPRALLVSAMASLLAVAIAGALGGALAAAAALPLLMVLGAFAVWLRLQKLRRRLVAQLPSLLDAMVRLITIGNSTQAAFQLAVAGTKPPLRDFMDNASSLAKAGVDLDQALLQIAQQTRVEELHLFSAIVGLSVRYGGRSDVLLERVAAFMRDREQAESELNALSAETRLSAWVLGLLPVVVGGLIIVVNASYFMHMWEDPSGRKMVLGALGLQLCGGFLLYRLARLDS